MQRAGMILNPRLIAAIVGLGHTQSIVVCDAGLPIPPGVELLDLSLVVGVPGFLQTVEVIAAALQVERVIVASELAEADTETHNRIGALFPKARLQQVAHEEFKDLTPAARLIVRTGECSPYANAILVGGVTF